MEKGQYLTNERCTRAKIKTFASTGGCQANPGTCVDICYTSDARTSSNKRNNLFKQMECS